MARPVNQQFFSNWSAEMAYVFGFWFADGWMTQPHTDASICFVSKDRDHLELIRGVMQSEHRIHSQGEGCFRLPIGSKQLWHDLYHLGGMPAKSLVAPMPFVPQEYKRHFIRGVIDGDGCLYWLMRGRRKPALSIRGNVLFLEKLAQTIDEEIGVGVAKVKNYSYQTPFIAYDAIKAKVVAKWLYTPGDLMLERKAAIAREFCTWEIAKRGWKSESVLTTKMQAILVS